LFAFTQERNPEMTHQTPQNLRSMVRELQEIFEQLLPAEQEYAQRHGNARLETQWLATVAIITWGWTHHETVTQRVVAAIVVANSVLGVEDIATRQGFQKALKSISQKLVPQVIDCFAEYTSKIAGHWSSGGKVNFAIDGTKFSAPRTEANQKMFAASQTTKKKKTYNKKSDAAKAATVQLLVTTAWHIGTGLPYRWKIDGSAGSERQNLISMLSDLPGNARLIADAEYVGYPLWSEIMRQGKTFLVRVGANITFIKNLEKHPTQKGCVSYWPAGRMNKKESPLLLRLIKINEGDQTIYLATNELDMTDEQASKLYRMRWGIEVFFRSVKESCERRQLCCRTRRECDR